MLFASAPLSFALENDFSQGEITGVAANEGLKPKEVLNIQMPVVRAKAAGFGQFDFVIDPVGIIRRTSAKRFTEGLNVGAVGIGSGNLFFLRQAKDAYGNAFYSLTKNSDSLTIVNKSSTPVDVELSFNVTKADEEDTFPIRFVDNDSFLDEEENALTVPALYLAIKTGRRASPVEAVTNEDNSVSYMGTLKGWIPEPDAANKVFKTVWNSENHVYEKQQAESAEDSDFNSLTFYMTGAINANVPAWANAELNMDMSVVWTVKKQAASSLTEDPYVEDFDPLVTVEVAAENAGDPAALLIDYGTGNKAMSRVDKVVYTTADEETAELTELVVDGTQVVFEADAAMLAGKDWKLRFSGDDEETTIDIPFNLVEADEPDIVEPDPRDPVVTIKGVKKAAEKAVLTVDWGFGSKAMTTITKVNYKNQKGTSATLSGSAISISGDTVNITVSKAAFTGSDFVLVFSNSVTGATFEQPCDLIDRTSNPTPTPKPTSTPTPTPTPTSTPTPTVTPTETPGATPTETPEATPTETPQGASVPSITVNQAASASGNTVNFSLDLGSYTDLKVVSLLYVLSGKTTDSTASIQGSLPNLSVSASKAIFNGSDWRVLLSSDDGSQQAIIPLTLKSTGTSYGAVTTLVQSVSAQGGTATVSVDLGDAYTSVSHMVYWLSGKTADTSASVQGSDPSAVTLSASKAIFNGSNWRIVVADESGNTLKVPFNLKG